MTPEAMLGESAYPVSLRDRWHVAAAVIRSIAAGGISGLVAGVLVAGVGGRIAMRVSALADPSANGALTDSGNRVGDITLDGTFGLVVFGGIFGGIFGAIVWVMVRPWLRALGPWRHGAAAIVSATAGTVFVIDAGNPDFQILDPPLLNVAMFLGLLAVFGVSVSVTDSWLSLRLPHAQGWGVAGYAALVLIGLPFIIPALGIYLSDEFCDCGDPPRLAGAFLVLSGALTAISWVLLIAAGDAEKPPPRWLRRTGELAVVGLVIAGGAYTIQQITDII